MSTTGKKAAEKSKRPDPVTIRKGVKGQTCTGCDRWKALTEYGRTSKARGHKPMRRCTECIRGESQARAAAKKVSAENKPKGDKSKSSDGAKSKPPAKGRSATRRAAK